MIRIAGLLVIDRAPSHEDPIMTVVYHPQRGTVTIRDILATVRGVNGQFKATIYHPPTIEERSRAMQLRERRRLLLRLLLSFVVAIPTFLISVIWMSLVSFTNRVRIFFQGKMWAGADTRAEWALFFLATPVMFFAADVFHVRAIKEIRALWGRYSKVPILRRFYCFGSMNLLISAGTSVAYFPSIAVLALDSRRTSQSNGQILTYFDAVVFLTMFILAGRYLEAYSKAKTGDAVTPDVEDSSKDSQPSLPTTNVEKINVDLLEVGDMVRVLRGASPPADGTIALGDSTFNESSLTGESRPITKNAGDQVFAGTVNTGKPISVRVTEISGASMLDQIVKVGGVLPESWRDVDTGGWAFWALQFAIAVFVGACPCGIALAAPTALFVGSGLAAQHGILVKGGGEAFQEASALDVVVFDKTGTLTEGGNPSVINHDIMASSAEETKVIWAIAQALEESSSHPIAKAITALCAEQNIAAVTNSTIEELPGRGLKGAFTIHTSTNDTRYEAAIGSETFITSLGTPIDICWSNSASTWKVSGKSIALLALRPLSLSDGKEAAFKLAAQLATTDPLRPEANQIDEHNRLYDQKECSLILVKTDILSEPASGDSNGLAYHDDAGMMLFDLTGGIVQLLILLIFGGEFSAQYNPCRGQVEEDRGGAREAAVHRRGAVKATLSRSALVKFEYLEWNEATERPDPEHVEHVKRIFRKERCRPLVVGHHMPAVVDRHRLDAALEGARRKGRWTTDGLPSSYATTDTQDGYLDFDFPGGIECLHERHRIQAGREWLPPTEKWWVVDLYLSGISYELKTLLIEEYANEEKPCDGEIYRKIREYQFLPGSIDSNVSPATCVNFENRWWARFNPSREKKLRSLFRNPTLAVGFDALGKSPGIFDDGMMATTLHKMMATSCYEAAHEHMREEDVNMGPRSPLQREHEHEEQQIMPVQNVQSTDMVPRYAGTTKTGSTTIIRFVEREGNENNMSNTLREFHVVDFLRKSKRTCDRYHKYISAEECYSVAIREENRNTLFLVPDVGLQREAEGQGYQALEGGTQAMEGLENHKIPQGDTQKPREHQEG
ncbi:hypothetical protein G7Y89_g6306 [Cudoniella acicularis]|uniref:P-type ATPase A domain-containing protein n=1 Tax=Cudoniella acicularis TaxID=354080 RepID=A0A8H4RN68_9HELO|nr:hypothetical protein G7Y89_g6306 [Cudoniella acicularis]